MKMRDMIINKYSAFPKLRACRWSVSQCHGLVDFPFARLLMFEMVRIEGNWQQEIDNKKVGNE